MADPYQALYRRYRSKRFSEQRGQDDVMRALRTAVVEDRVGHAYLFSGPRGTGKTSTARILAKALNCEALEDGEPCGRCPNCVAVDEGRIVDWLLELDAASNNGVAQMRELIDRLPLGTSGRRKVVILDEVHMLSAGASNALLKSLEEPPAHVVFILATTDPQKVLPTIRSRTQHFEFHLLPADELAEHVRHVIADAGLDLGEDAVQWVIRQGGGSARDTLSALDQVAAMGRVPGEGQPVDALLDALVARDAGAALVAVAEAASSGRDPRTLGETLIARLRDAFLALMDAPDRHLPEADRARATELGQTLGAARLTRALEVLGESLVELARKPDPRIVLEVALVRLCRPEADTSPEAILDRLERLERTVASGVPAASPGAAPAGGVVPPGAGPAPAPAPANEPTSAAPPVAGGPAAAARAELARIRGAAAAPGGGKPRQPVKKATAPAAPAPPRPAAEAPAAPAAPAPAPVTATAGGAGLPSLEELTAAWPQILAGFKPSLRAAYEEGRFTEVSATHAHLMLSAGHVRAGEPRRAEVEAALARHFGRPVPLKLVAGGPTADPDEGPRGGAAAAPVDDDHDEDIGDLSELEDAPDAATGLARVVEAFPGAELLEEP